MDISYADTPYEVREDFGQAHSRFWRRLANPGAWWTGAQRVAIAAEVRGVPNCALCSSRKASLSPYAVDGEHDQMTDLPASAVEVIHRVTSDPGRLTQRWYQSVIDAGLAPEAYVEIIGTVVAAISIDSFCHGLGLANHALPTPEQGEPSAYRPASAADEDAWVPMIPASANAGPEADLWQQGRTGNVIRAMSVVPDEVRTLNDLGGVHYLPHEQVGNPNFEGRALTRPQIELIAGRVSAINQCFY